MAKIATAERVSLEKSDNYVFQRSVLAYHRAAELVEGDILEIGTGMGYGVEVIAPKATRYISIDKENPLAIEPTATTIAELTPSHIGNYVVINHLSFKEQAGMTWCDKDPLTGQYITTVRTAYDSDNRPLSIRTIAQCDYRSEAIPSGQGSLYGIVEYVNGEYTLRIVNHGIVF